MYNFMYYINLFHMYIYINAYYITMYYPKTKNINLVHYYIF